MTLHGAPFRALPGTLLPGTLLVVALVVALPATLALCPVDTLGCDGAGAGTGDLIAAALSGLDRDLHGAGPLPPATRHPLVSVPALAATPWPIGDRLSALASSHGLRDVPPLPAAVLAGPGADGHPLLL